MSQRAWETEKRYFGGERRTGAGSKNPECGISKNMVRDALTEEPRTAGEITRLLDPTRVNFSRFGVKRHLDKLVKLGEALLELKDVTRNGFLVRDAAHYRRTADS